MHLNQGSKRSDKAKWLMNNICIDFGLFVVIVSDYFNAKVLK